MSKIITLSKLKTALEPLIALIGKKAEKPNWNENNPESVSYIANRPFYSCNDEIIVMPEATISQAMAESSITEPLVVGNTYTITFDGVDYECVCREYDGYRMLGNNAVYEYDNEITTDTGEPFAFKAEGNDLGIYWYFPEDDSATHTVSIKRHRKKVVKIPAEYLPEIEMAKPDWNSNDENSSSYIKNRTHYYGEKIFNSTWIDNVTFTGFSNGRKVLSVSEVQSIPKLKEHKGWNYNSLYTVIWDGVEYPNIAVSGRSGEPGLSMHGGNINIGFDGSLKIYCYNDDVSESHTISVYEYTDTVTLTGTINGLEQYNTIDFPEMEFPPFFDGETYYVEYTLFNQHIACQGKANDGALYFDEYYRISTGDGGIVSLDYIHGSNCSWSPSSVTFYSSDKLPEYQETLAITFSRGTKPLDEAFIPKNIARLEQVPAVDNTLSIEGAAADAKAVGDALAETGVWYVHATANDDGSFTLDKTYDDIIAAYNAGRKVQCEMRYEANPDEGAYIFDLITFGPYVPDVYDGDTVYNGALFVLWMQNRMMRMLVTTDNQVMMFQTNRFQTEGELQIRYGKELMYAGHMGVDVDIDLNIPINAPKDYVAFTDQVNGYIYYVSMRNGTLVSTCAIKTIEVASMPTTVEYTAGDAFDPSGLTIMTTRYDGTTAEVTDFTYDAPETLTEDVTAIPVTYTDMGVTYTVDVPITVVPFDPEKILVDFEYTDNGDGTYTITGWKGTNNGEASTEMIIPNYSCIIV